MKKLILVFVMLVQASYSYALELNKAVILEHHSWITGFDENGKALSGNLQNLHNKLSSATTSAYANNARGTVDHNIYTSGSHTYNVTNSSSSYQTYTIDIKLCANSTYCFHDQTRVGVDKGGYFSNTTNSYLTCMFSKAGNYGLEAVTSISGDTSSNANNRATIYVTK